MTYRAAVPIVFALVALTAAPRAQDPPKPGPKDLVVVVEGQRTYHEPACPEVKTLKRPAVTMRARAELLGLAAHDCRAAINKALASDATQLVWVDLQTKRYHLPGCSLVGTPRAQVSLAHARASYAPCPACRPPK